MILHIYFSISSDQFKFCDKSSEVPKTHSCAMCTYRWKVENCQDPSIFVINDVAK